MSVRRSLASWTTTNAEYGRNVPTKPTLPRLNYRNRPEVVITEDEPAEEAAEEPEDTEPLPGLLTPRDYKFPLPWEIIELSPRDGERSEPDMKTGIEEGRSTRHSKRNETRNNTRATGRSYPNTSDGRLSVNFAADSQQGGTMAYVIARQILKMRRDRMSSSSLEMESRADFGLDTDVEEINSERDVLPSRGPVRQFMQEQCGRLLDNIRAVKGVRGDAADSRVQVLSLLGDHDTGATD